MDEKVKCPYCGEEVKIPLDEYGEEIACNEPFHFDCPNCGLIFNVEPYTTITLRATVCPCQGENHEWKLSQTYPKCCSKMECIHCGETRNLTDEEMEKYNIGTIKELGKKIAPIQCRAILLKTIE